LQLSLTPFSKYLIGADGGRSTVRRIGQFPFPGTSTPLKWVRLDAIVETNMPHSHAKPIALESKSFGNVLWVPTDSGYTRIGFVFPDDLAPETATEETILSLARKAVEPFTLEFKKVDWWTIYAIGQRVAEKYRKGSVFLAGDAAHTHSSGAAQVKCSLSAFLMSADTSHRE
jgi:phenol 2-monooxygenase (NADPH)